MVVQCFDQITRYKLSTLLALCSVLINVPEVKQVTADRVTKPTSVFPSASSTVQKKTLSSTAMPTVRVTKLEGVNSIGSPEASVTTSPTDTG